MEERIMITIIDLKNELQKAIEMETLLDRVKAYRSVLVSAVKYLYQKKEKAVPEKQPCCE